MRLKSGPSVHPLRRFWTRESVRLVGLSELLKSQQIDFALLPMERISLAYLLKIFLHVVRTVDTNVRVDIRVWLGSMFGEQEL